MEKEKMEMENQTYSILLMFKLWEEWTATLPEQTQEERAEQEKHLAYFTAKTNAKKNSPAYLMYSAFMAGVGKGIDLVEKMEKIKSPTSEAHTDRASHEPRTVRA